MKISKKYGLFNIPIFIKILCYTRSLKDYMQYVYLFYNNILSLCINVQQQSLTLKQTFKQMF